MTHSLKWWQTGVIYQIYPRSFMDANGDGVGDLQGIMDRVDYLAGLGIDAVWISPIYPSPMADFGYDVANYTDIHPLFGDMATFDRLLAAVHARGLKLILEIIPQRLGLLAGYGGAFSGNFVAKFPARSLGIYVKM